MTDSPFLLLALIAAVGAACFYAGWRSAASYLQAARAVSEVTNAVASQSNSFTSALDKADAEYALLRKEVERNTEVLGANQKNVEEALLTLFQGFERSGLVRSARPAPGRQVGEASTE